MAVEEGGGYFPGHLAGVGRSISGFAPGCPLWRTRRNCGLGRHWDLFLLLVICWMTLVSGLDPVSLILSFPTHKGPPQLLQF